MRKLNVDNHRKMLAVLFNCHSYPLEWGLSRTDGAQKWVTVTNQSKDVYIKDISFRCKLDWGVLTDATGWGPRKSTNSEYILTSKVTLSKEKIYFKNHIVWQGKHKNRPKKTYRSFMLRLLFFLFILFISCLQLNTMSRLNKKQLANHSIHSTHLNTFASAWRRCLSRSIFLCFFSCRRRSYFRQCSSILRALGSTCHIYSQWTC